jgi:4-amino-4-deoxy-L-arabinose transferase-like glycosyltransferase
MVLVLIGKDLFAEGMFLDGVFYACLSRNMACGMGDFWNPYYTETIGAVFHSHLPLAFGLEALMFKFFGDHFFIERIYSLLMFLLSGLMIVLVWKRTTNNLRWAWMPLLYWVAMPLVSWSVNNNMLENTMTVFVLLSVYLMIVSYQKNHKIWLFLAGISLFAAFLSKGVTGLFPLIFPLIYCIFDEKRRWFQGIIDGLLLLVTLAVLTGLMFLVFPQSLVYMKDYINLQLVGGAMQEVTVSSRFFIVFKLLQQLIGPLGIVAVLVIMDKVVMKSKVKVFEFPPDKRRFFVFLITGLAGVLPIMVSMKQSGYYMVAALPFFALAMGHVSISMVNSIQGNMKPNKRRWMIVTGLAFVWLGVGVFMTLYGINRYCRDEVLLRDVKQVLASTADEQVLGISTADYQQWAWHAYFMRYGKVNLDDRNPHKYLLFHESGHLKTVLNSNF